MLKPNPAFVRTGTNLMFQVGDKYRIQQIDEKNHEWEIRFGTADDKRQLRLNVGHNACVLSYCTDRDTDTIQWSQTWDILSDKEIHTRLAKLTLEDKFHVVHSFYNFIDTLTDKGN